MNERFNRPPRSHEVRDDVSVGGPRTGRLGRIYDRALDTLAVIEDGSPADRALATTFKRARDLGSSERHAVSDMVYGIQRARRRLDDLLARAVKAQKKKLEIFERPLVLRWLTLTYLADQGADSAALAEQDPYAHKRIPGLFERITAGRVPVKKRKPATALAIEMSLPDWMATRLIQAAGEDGARAIGEALALRAPLTLRVNTQRIDRATARDRIRDEHGAECDLTELTDTGLIMPDAADVKNWPIFREGLVEIQDEGSQLIADAVGAQPGESVVDACAGAGGKTLALASAMQGSGRIVAIDVDGKKLEELKRRARRTDLSNFEAVKTDLITFPQHLMGWADRVLVDAPCSGSGVFRRQPDARWRLDESRFRKFPSLQAALLRRAIDLSKPGAWLVYATCSVLKEENEDVVERVVAEDDRITKQPLALTLGDERAERLEATWCLRVGPGPTERGPDGYFIALLQRG